MRRMVTMERFTATLLILSMTLAQVSAAADEAPPLVEPLPTTRVELTAPMPVEVSVDGQVVGATPLTLALAPRTYTFRAIRSGYAPVTSVVIVRAGEPRRIVFPLDDSRAGATWVWLTVGLAGAVALGTVLGVALVQNR